MEMVMQYLQYVPAVLGALLAGWAQYRKLIERAENSSALDILTDAIEMNPDNTKALKKQVSMGHDAKVESSVDRLDREKIREMLREKSPPAKKDK